MSRRRFTLKQRIAMLWASGGDNAVCAICGEPLPEGWHADHRKPWSRGGATVASNGDVTCPRCNLRKGARDDSRSPSLAATRSPFAR
jgi:5-methylcytosine-specific restriction endonuclease McrA